MELQRSCKSRDHGGLSQAEEHLLQGVGRKLDFPSAPGEVSEETEPDSSQYGEGSGRRRNSGHKLDGKGKTGDEEKV